MARLVRFGVSLEEELLKQFDRLINVKGYANRSEAIRDLIREELVKKEWQQNKMVAATVTIIYDHHQRQLVNKILEVQHDYSKVILASQHIHLDHDNCLEIIAVKAEAGKARDLAGRLKAIKGVRHATVSMSTTGRTI